MSLMSDEPGSTQKARVEFRVRTITRYQVTRWEEYNPVTGNHSTSVVADNLTLDQAISIATVCGKANPDATVYFDAGPVKK